MIEESLDSKCRFFSTIRHLGWFVSHCKDDTRRHDVSCREEKGVSSRRPGGRWIDGSSSDDTGLY